MCSIRFDDGVCECVLYNYCIEYKQTGELCNCVEICYSTVHCGCSYICPEWHLNLLFVTIEMVGEFGDKVGSKNFLNT